MAIDTHIKFDGVDGESSHRDHKGEIAVLSWNWGLAAPAPAHGGAAASKATPADFRFVHAYDKASPLLARAGARGNVFKQVSLTARKSGEGQKDFLKVTMKEVFVTSVQLMSDADAMVEEVALSPRFISYDYAPTDAKGSLGPTVAFSWNLATGAVK
jgi:type VI secretion system secreted protein Hcp